MALINLDSYLAAVGAGNSQLVNYTKLGALTSVAGGYHSVWSPVGYPYNTVWSAGNTANGVIPVAGQTGYPYLKTITGIGYLTRKGGWGTTGLSLGVYDDLFKCGAYNFNANVTLTAQPSYAARVPSADYRGLEIWLEAATTFTGNLTINVTYTNQDGVTGRTYGAYATAIAPIIGRMIRIPLQAGDSGVMAIKSVVATVSTAGTFNLHVLRPLTRVDTTAAYGVDQANLFETGCPIVYDTTAIFVVAGCSTTTTGVIQSYFEIVDA